MNKKLLRVLAAVLVVSVFLCCGAFAVNTEEGGYVNVGENTDGPDIELITDDHFAYIEGYPDGTFRPDGNLSRAEAATIFYRLLVDKTYTNAASFSDVASDSWYYTAVTALASKGIIKGYPDGTFGPDRSVTRAEFCALSARFFNISEGEVSFTDVPTTHWAYQYIASAVNKGWITDSTTAFKPDEAITRAEVVSIVNHMLGRSADKNFLTTHSSELVKFGDVKSGDICYNDVMEAANGHLFTKSGNVETWSSLK